MLHLPFQHRHLAGAADSVVAGVGQPHSGPQGRVQERLPRLHFYGFAYGFDGRPVSHRARPAVSVAHPVHALKPWSEHANERIVGDAVLL